MKPEKNKDSDNSYKNKQIHTSTLLILKNSHIAITITIRKMTRQIHIRHQYVLASGASTYGDGLKTDLYINLIFL